MKKDITVIALVSGIAATLVILVEPQEDVIKNIIVWIFSAWWIFSTLAISTRRISKIIRSWKVNPYLLVSLSTILPELIFLLAGINQPIDTFLFLIWYTIPAILFNAELRGNDENRFIKYSRPIFSSFGLILLWIGFDHRYTSPLFEGLKGLSYLMNSLWIAHVISINFGYWVGVIQDENMHDSGITPSLEGAKIAFIHLNYASIVIVPFGLLTGFLVWNPIGFDPQEIIIGFIGIFLTVALQEELVFRSGLTQLSDKVFTNKSREIMLVVIAFGFGLTHWNNERPEFVVHYIFAATVAGIAYAFAYRKGWLFSAVLTHTMIDWIWKLFLTRP